MSFCSAGKDDIGLSEWNKYDAVYASLEASGFSNSVRSGFLEWASVDGVGLEGGREYALLPTVSIFASTIPGREVDSSGKKKMMSLGAASYRSRAGLLLGIHDFNNGIGSVVREAAGINETCNVRLVTDVFDSEGSQSVAVDLFVREMLKHEARPPAALFGASRSSVSVALGILSGIYGIPQMSALSTSTDLDNRDNFPFFTRLIPSDAGAAQAAVSYLRDRMDVTHCGVVFVNDAYGGAYHLAFKESAVNRPSNDTISVTSFGFTSGSDQQLLLAVKQMRDTGYRVFFAIIYRSHFDQLMTEAFNLGIAGPGFVWIMADGVSEGFLNNRVFPHASPLAIATMGVAILKAQGGIPAEPGQNHTGYDRFLEAWYKQDHTAVQYYNCKQPKNNTRNNAQEVYYQADPDFFHSRQIPPTRGAVFHYDTVMALGLAACNLTLNNKHQHDQHSSPATSPSQKLFTSFISSNFEGASGTIKIDPLTATRHPSSALFVLYNAHGTLDPLTNNITIHTTLVSTTVSNPTNQVRWETLQNRSFIYSDNTTTKPPNLPIPNLNKNQLNSIRYAGFALAIIILLTSFLFALWSCYYRNHRVVRISQPLFLVIICLGTFLMGISIIASGIDDQIANLHICHVACMTSTWLIFIGFTVTFSGLFSKIWRMNKIFRNLQQRNIQVSIKDVMLPFILLFTINAILLLLWTLTSPIKWTRIQTKGTDSFGRHVNSYGTCTLQNDTDLIYIVLLIIVNIGVLVLANVQAYRARTITDEFSESKYVAIAMASVLQAFVVGLPVIALVIESPPAYFFIRSGIIFVLCMSILLLIFVPKMIHMRQVEQRELKR